MLKKPKLGDFNNSTMHVWIKKAFEMTSQPFTETKIDLNFGVL